MKKKWSNNHQTLYLKQTKECKLELVHSPFIQINLSLRFTFTRYATRTLARFRSGEGRTTDRQLHVVIHFIVKKLLNTNL